MNKLKIGFKSAYGRNRGRISSYHRQRGNKKVYKIIDFSRTLFDIQGKVKMIQYDAYRNSKIAGIAYTNGLFSYMLAVEGLKVGDWILNTQNNLFKATLGSSCQIKDVKSSQKISNLEYYPGSGGKISRSAGTFSKIINRYNNNALIKLKSGEFRLFFLNCICTLGRVDNLKYNQIIIGKAGTNRLLGWRPIVRGRAMNPVDHPHGGRTNGGITPRTPWGQLTRGVKTVKKLKPQIIKKRIK
jgi:large subunit ribosomal protein L2